MILITGSTGFIGTYVVKELLKERSLRCITIEKNQTPLNNTELVYGNILDKKSLGIKQKIQYQKIYFFKQRQCSTKKQGSLCKIKIASRRNNYKIWAELCYFKT